MDDSYRDTLQHYSLYFCTIIQALLSELIVFYARRDRREEWRDRWVTIFMTKEH